MRNLVAFHQEFVRKLGKKSLKSLLFIVLKTGFVCIDSKPRYFSATTNNKRGKSQFLAFFVPLPSCYPIPSLNLIHFQAIFPIIVPKCANYQEETN